jgi:acetylornithine/succinyldiaminopimelate/putrescine aminotransferase
MPQFSFVPFNDMEAIRSAVTDDTAAVIIEPVQGEAGIFVAKEEYLRDLRHLCDEKNIILIFDEVQTGFGRTGKFFACEHSGVIPDILAMAKSIGGGMFPNGAVLYRDRAILTDFVCCNPQLHPTYTGGSDLGCLISLKVIDYIMDNNLPARAARNGRKLKDALEKLRLENPKIIREVRGIGMMVGIEYIHEFLGPMMSDALAKNGIFAAYSGNAPQVMRFMLPIVADDEDVDEVIRAIGRSVESMKILLPIALPAAKIPGVLKLLNNEKVQTGVFNWIRSLEDFFSRFNQK